MKYSIESFQFGKKLEVITERLKSTSASVSSEAAHREEKAIRDFNAEEKQ